MRTLLDTMVKTTVLLEDELYKRLVKEALERYGSTRKLSALINEKLRESRGPSPPSKKRLTVKLGRRLTEKELEESIERAWSGASKWNA